MLYVLTGGLAVYLLVLAGDFVYWRVVSHRLAAWEASVQRDSEGVLVGCREYATGSGDDAILLIHGINASPHEYRKMAPELSRRGYHCRVMRLPHFAEPTARYALGNARSWRDAVEGEVAALRAAGYHRVFVVAHSLGGAIAISWLLAKNTPPVDGIALLAPAVEVSNARSFLLSVETWHRIARRLLVFTNVTESPYSNDTLDERERDYPQRVRFLPRQVLDATFQLIDANRHRAGEFHVPLITFVATQDQVVDSDAARRFHQQTRGAPKQLVELPRSGHNIAVDYQWQEVTQEIDAFFRRCGE